MVRLVKQESIPRQIVNTIALTAMPSNKVNNCMKKIIDELSNYDSKLEKLTNYIINNYIEDVCFPLSMWNHFDIIGEKLCTNNHLESCHRQ